MDEKTAGYRGCLLGLAIGDAMGCAVDKKSWNEICEAYGPNGLLGFDEANGQAQISSYTQYTAFLCNGLLLGAIRANPAVFGKFLTLGAREWAKTQSYASGEKMHCWLSQVPALCGRNCMDTRLLDALTRETLGTPAAPVVRSNSPTALTSAVAVGLCRESTRLSLEGLCNMAATAMAFTHGEPEAYIAGAFLAVSIARLLQNSSRPLLDVYRQTCEDMLNLYGDRAQSVVDLVEQAIAMTRDPELSPLAALSVLGCGTAAECLAGAVYVSIIHSGNFDEAMIVSVNHSGHSAAVAAVTGALLGARLGVENLPEFYLESLDCVDTLTELADDLLQARQVMNLFDDRWEMKYSQGKPAG